MDDFSLRTKEERIQYLKTMEERIQYLLDFIARQDTELEVTKIYGLGWKIRDWLSRRSILSGDLCLTRMELERVEAKKIRSGRGSIGYRKAKAKARIMHKKIRILEQKIALPYEDYQVTEPEYFKTPVPDEVTCYERESIRKKELKRCERLGYQSTSDDVYIIPLEGLDPIA